MKYLKISVITATYNVGQTVATCLQSLNQQSIPCEHLVVDGLSSDNTIQKIKELSPTSIVNSEKDKGLYDALNKGVKMTTGDVVGILNADDFYAAPDVLQQVQNVFRNSNVDACYGDLLYISESDGKTRIVRYWQSKEFNTRKFFWGWMPPHPTFFVRKAVYEKYGLFNLNLGTAADYELMLRFLVKHQICCTYIPEILIHMRTGGMSNSSIGNRLKANSMDRRAWEMNGLQPYPWTIPLKPLRKIPQWWMRPDGKTGLRAESED